MTTNKVHVVTTHFHGVVGRRGGCIAFVTDYTPNTRKQMNDIITVLLIAKQKNADICRIKTIKV